VNAFWLARLDLAEALLRGVCYFNPARLFGL
jgi:hypothetical protein